MAEVLAHPWLEGYTPGILYVPAPPVSELAKPLPSASHIDRDLFQSLCVIWGRYCDSDRIKTDLLSPAGEGTLCKAFYFLLQKHRERTMAEHGILMDDILKSPGKVVTKQYSAPKARPRKAISEMLPERSASQPPRAARSAIETSTRSSSPTRATGRPTLAMLQAPAMERTRAVPPSPVGPRPQRPRPTSSPVGDRRPSSIGPPISYRYEPPRTRSGSQGPSSGSTSHDADTARAAQQMSDMIASLPHHRMASTVPSLPARTPSTAENNVSQVVKDYEAAASSVIHAPVPLQASSQKILPMITAPKVNDAQMQRKMDEYANMINAQAQGWNATVSAVDQTATLAESTLGNHNVNMDVDSSREPQAHADHPMTGTSRRTEEKGRDKENVDHQSTSTLR